MDYSSLLGGGGGGGGSSGSPGIGSQGKGASTAASIFGNYNDSSQLATALPWAIGGVALVLIVFAFVIIAAIRQR
jgi:hypothetical protein